jgi:hypothetical protein
LAYNVSSRIRKGKTTNTQQYEIDQHRNSSST